MSETRIDPAELYEKLVYETPLDESGACVFCGAQAEDDAPLKHHDDCLALRAGEFIRAVAQGRTKILEIQTTEGGRDIVATVEATRNDDRFVLSFTKHDTTTVWGVYESLDEAYREARLDLGFARVIWRDFAPMQRVLVEEPCQANGNWSRIRLSKYQGIYIIEVGSRVALKTRDRKKAEDEYQRLCAMSYDELEAYHRRLGSGE